MFKLLYWGFAAAMLLVFPGVSILMGLCYVAYLFISTLWGAGQPSSVSRYSQSPAGQNETAEGTEISAPAPTEGHDAAALFAEEARVMAEEREEDELLTQNAAQQELDSSRTEVEQSWQDRLENGYRP
ncbi:hypothetical protein [Polaromonas sp. JS666]|uniref:hypothetical protein n=1 Tax=Polaromonas sp. (strain JS666 / ATCC BAA-500) TaxID=296591 RepID=UPI000053255B|nr:hypothetical protein [Polaromonas sp. JS666]ABE47312.1 hypothetical protein Bpro_5458 [Polaromonas sp. JS666]